MNFKVLTCARRDGSSRAGTAVSQMLKVMKLTSFFLCAFLVQVSARGWTQTVTVRVKSEPLEKIFATVEKQTGYLFFYDADLVKSAKPVTINAQSEPLSQFLDEIFASQPLRYSIKNKSVIVSPKPGPIPPAPAPATPGNPAEATQKPAALPGPLTGRVTDKDGQPLQGASVSVKGKSIGTQTDAHGNFSLDGLDPEDVLLVSYTEMETQTIKVGHRTTLSVTLKPSDNPLDKVVVIAYGKTSQRLSTGNVASVSAREIQEQPVSNPLLALQGRVPGLFLQQTSGLPDGGFTVKVQGQNSLFNGNNPLYVVDGVPVVQQNNSTWYNDNNVNGYSDGHYNNSNPLMFINPADIESISILKDADATAIYGSRAANGAILVTTKKGASGATKVDLNVQSGFSKVGYFPPVLNTSQYLAMRHEALANAGMTPSATDYDLNGTWDTTKGHNWEKELYSGAAQFTDAQLAISGGGANTQYYIGGSYNQQGNVYNYEKGRGIKRGGLHFSLSSASANQRFRAQLTGSFMYDVNKTTKDMMQAGLELCPVAPALLNPDGSMNWAPDASGSSTWSNPLQYVFTNNGLISTKNLTSNLQLSYRILPGLNVKGSFGYNLLQNNENGSYPIASNPPELQPYSTGFAYFNTGSSSYWSVEPQITYDRHIGKGKLSVLVGTSFQDSRTLQYTMTGSGYTSDLLLGDINSAPNKSAGSSYSLYKYDAVFGIVNYNWEDKYIIDLNGRRDGSSRFGPAQRFSNFGSVGGAWLFSNERLFKRSLAFLSFGKLKASYGITGNDQIGDYMYLNQYSANSVNVPYQGVTSYNVNGLPNPYLHWESDKKANFGIDLGFAGDRILLGVNYFINRSSNQLLSFPLPTITGVSSYTGNFPATVQNTGGEITLTSTIVKTKDFRWSVTGNVTIARNKLVKFAGLDSSYYAGSLIVGKPVTIRRLYHYIGVDPQTGLFTYMGRNGQPTITPSYPNDATSIFDPTPKYYGGFGTSLSYKGVQLDAFFEIVNEIAPKFQYNWQPGYFWPQDNQPVAMLNRWRQPGDNAFFQKVSSVYSGNSVDQALGAYGASDGSFGRGNYIRFKNVSLSWNIPAEWSQRFKMEHLRVFVHGENLLTFSPYKDEDPEIKNVFDSQAPLRTWTFGLSLGF